MCLVLLLLLCAVVLLQMTGIASTADYLDYWPTAGEYRKHSPG